MLYSRACGIDALGIPLLYNSSTYEVPFLTFARIREFLPGSYYCRAIIDLVVDDTDPCMTNSHDHVSYRFVETKFEIPLRSGYWLLANCIEHLRSN